MLLVPFLLTPLVLSHDDYASCASPSTYTNYSRVTPPKGLNQHRPWDRTSRRFCNFTSSAPDDSCGDCDVGFLKSGTWYRFPDPNPVVSVVRFSATCPSVGYCNGYNQILLTRSAEFSTGHIGTVYHRIVVSRKGKCSHLGQNTPDDFVSELRCRSFSLYRFPAVLEQELSCYSSNGTVWQPYSLCLADSVGTNILLWTWYVVIGVVFVMAILIFVVAFFFYKQNLHRKRSVRYTSQRSVEPVSFTRQSTHLYDDLGSMGVSIAQAREESSIVVSNPLAIEQVLNQLENEAASLADSITEQSSVDPSPVKVSIPPMEDPLLNAVAVQNESNDTSLTTTHPHVVVNEPCAIDTGIVISEEEPQISDNSVVKYAEIDGSVVRNRTLTVQMDSRQHSEYLTLRDVVESPAKGPHSGAGIRFSKLARRSTHLYEDLLTLGLTPVQATEYIRLQSCSGPLTSKEFLSSLSTSDYIVPNEVLPYLEDAVNRDSMSVENRVEVVPSREQSSEHPETSATNCSPNMLSSECKSCQNNSCCSGQGTPVTADNIDVVTCDASRDASRDTDYEVMTSVSNNLNRDNSDITSQSRRLSQKIDQSCDSSSSDPIGRLSQKDKVKILDHLNRVSLGEDTGSAASCVCKCEARREKALRLCSI